MHLLKNRNIKEEIVLSTLLQKCYCTDPKLLLKTSLKFNHHYLLCNFVQVCITGIASLGTWHSERSLLIAPNSTKYIYTTIIYPVMYLLFKTWPLDICYCGLYIIITWMCVASVYGIYIYELVWFKVFFGWNTNWDRSECPFQAFQHKYFESVFSVQFINLFLFCLKSIAFSVLHLDMEWHLRNMCRQWICMYV